MSDRKQYADSLREEFSQTRKSIEILEQTIAEDGLTLTPEQNIDIAGSIDDLYTALWLIRSKIRRAFADNAVYGNRMDVPKDLP